MSEAGTRGGLKQVKRLPIDRVAQTMETIEGLILINNVGALEVSAKKGGKTGSF